MISIFKSLNEPGYTQKSSKTYSFLLYYSILFLILVTGCASMENSPRPAPGPDETGYFYETEKGHEIYVFSTSETDTPENTIFLLSGITGINHNQEKDVIDLLAGTTNKVVVIHPRGTGYSSGDRGSIQDFSAFIDDHVEIIRQFMTDFPEQNNILFGHSMSTALALEIGSRIKDINGVILVNPPLKRKEAEGMSPSIGDYINYAGYYIFAPHTPIVNMSGDPNLIENPEERREAENRAKDPLLVKYFSLHTMMESQQMMLRMEEYAKTAGYPLLLIYGTADSIVDKEGVDIIFENWAGEDKTYVEIDNGPHGKRTVLEAGAQIMEWIDGVD